MAASAAAPVAGKRIKFAARLALDRIGRLRGLHVDVAAVEQIAAKALEDTELCEIGFLDLEQLCQSIPGLQRQLLRIMSREIARDEQVLMLLGKMTAEERLAACLISFAERHERLGGEANMFRLSMSRQDLADYLGLALETVSRLFSRFQEDGLIRVQGRRIQLLDCAQLTALAKGGEETALSHKGCTAEK